MPDIISLLKSALQRHIHTTHSNSTLLLSGVLSMLEAVRLVIWDLDDTFWRGTVTEGGVEEYIQSHHDLIIDLAQRGIMSSICSKNDKKTIRNILVDKGIYDYFIFPNISWEPKGVRVASMVKAVGLRPETVMFIDDNPGNRAEVASVVPGIQIRDEKFIAEMLDHELFRGKDDRALSRLKQYKVLEKRKQDEDLAGGDNTTFLRASNIKVRVKRVDKSNIARAVELVNRTNQLNFTKERLNEGQGAEDELLRQMEISGRACGIVVVKDNYGDYGDIGFYLLDEGGPERRLLHFCFSCRTLGMGIESWVYNQLGRPSIAVVGDVLTDLTVRQDIDWITLQQDAEETIISKKAIALLRAVGGCEANAISPYLEQEAEVVEVEANFATSLLFVRVNSSTMLLSADTRDTPEFAEEMTLLDIPVDKMRTKFFRDAPDGTMLVLSFQLDAGYTGYRHRRHGWHITVEPDSFWGDLTESDPRAFEEYLTTRKILPERAQKLRGIADHMRANYESVRGPSPELLAANMATIFDGIPQGSKLVLLAPGHVVRSGGKIQDLDWISSHNRRLSTIAEGKPYVGIVYIDDLVNSEAEVAEGWNHYERPVYMRIAKALVDKASTLEAKR